MWRKEADGVILKISSYYDGGTHGGVGDLVDSGQEPVDPVAQDVADRVASVLVDDVPLAAVQWHVFQFGHLKMEAS